QEILYERPQPIGTVSCMPPIRYLNTALGNEDRSSESGEQVAELFAFGAEIRARACARRRTAGNSLRHSDARFFELFYLVRIIRQQPHAADAQRLQRFGREFVVARVGVKSEMPVRLHGVQP